jgi:ElaB/YqjD/DUF883 family membrane-anchored ribosome-binding protein
MKNRNESTAQTPQDLLDDLHALVAEAEKMISDGVSEKSDDIISALRSRFESARERVADNYTSARKKVVAGAKSTDEAIRSNPYQSLAIALGAGLVVGLLVGRRSE